MITHLLIGYIFKTGMLITSTYSLGLIQVSKFAIGKYSRCGSSFLKLEANRRQLV
ncbi:hypothetical protein EVA_10331 [gut metagenome]|uniref:Uncharacterized protein n=1 Tax=gut metagenome TaxID=749906 RepID=J9GI29_9ZZZZ